MLIYPHSTPTEISEYQRALAQEEEQLVKLETYLRCLWLEQYNWTLTIPDTNSTITIPMPDSMKKSFSEGHQPDNTIIITRDKKERYYKEDDTYELYNTLSVQMQCKNLSPLSIQPPFFHIGFSHLPQKKLVTVPTPTGLEAIAPFFFEDNTADYVMWRQSIDWHTEKLNDHLLSAVQDIKNWELKKSTLFYVLLEQYLKPISPKTIKWTVNLSKSYWTEGDKHYRKNVPQIIGFLEDGANQEFSQFLQGNLPKHLFYKILRQPQEFPSQFLNLAEIGQVLLGDSYSEWKIKSLENQLQLTIPPKEKINKKTKI